MTNSQEPNPEQPTRRRRRWIRVGLTAGSVLVLAGAGAAWWSWIFLNERFSPWASTELTKALKRPVNVGQVERITLSGIRVGTSTIPATVTDSDALSLESVEVRFNLFDLLRRELNLDVELQNVEGYFEQNAELRWLDIEFESFQGADGKEPIIEVKPGTIRLRNSRLTLQPYADPGLPRQKVALKNVQADIEIQNPDVETAAGDSDTPQIQAREIDFEGTADSEKRGSLAIAGSILLPPAPEEAGEATSSLPSDLPAPISRLLALLNRLDQLGQALVLQPAIAASDNANPNAPEEGDDPVVDRRVRLNIRAQDAQAPEIAAIVFSLFEEKPPVSITSGDVNGNVTIDVLPEEPISVVGTAQVSNGIVSTKSLPTPITNIDGVARFKGQAVTFDSLNGNLKELRATTKGTVDFNRGYALTGQVNPFTLNQLKQIVKFTTPVPVEGVFAANLSLTGALQDPQLSVDLASQGATTIDKVQLAALGATISFDPEALVIDSFRAVPLAGGELIGSGRYTLGKPSTLTLTAQGRNLPADALGRPYGLPETVALGPVFVEVGVSGPINSLQGAASWRAPAGDFPARGDIEFAGRTVRFKDTFVQVGGGTISGNGLLANGNWNADLRASRVQLSRFNPKVQGIVTGDFQLAGDLETRGLAGIRGQGNATVALAQGTIDGTARLTNGNWNSDFRARGIQLSQFSPRANGTADGSFQLAGSLNDLSLTGIRGQGNATLVLAQGTVTAQGQILRGAWNATVNSDSVQLSQFSNALQGTAGGRFALSGNLNNLTLAGVRGQGTFVASDGLATLAPQFPQLAAIQEPLTGALAWNGSQLQIQQASSAGLFVSGTITPRLTGPAAPAISNLDLAVRMQDFNLAALPFPNRVPVAGRADFDGRLTGTPRNFNLVGDARLANLAVSDLQFEPLLAGPIQVSNAGGVNVELRGARDVIDVAYGLSDRNLDFTVRAGESLAVGGIENNFLRAQIVEFPLEVLNLPPGGVGGFGTIRGTVEQASITGDLSQPTLAGNFVIREPGLGYVNLRRFEGQIAYADGTTVLTGGKIEGDAGEYQVTGRYSRKGTPQLVAQIDVNSADIQELISTLQYFELEDFKRGFKPPTWFKRYTPTQLAEALPLAETGDPNDSLLEQLRRLAELLELEDAIASEAAASPLPPLSEFKGRFSGQISLSGSLPSDLTVGFDLAGQQWTWGNSYQVEQVVAKGRYADGVLSLDPVRFSSDRENGELAFVTLNGEIGIAPEDRTPRTLSVNAANVPLASLRKPLRLPTSIQGSLNANATVTGSLANPQLRGVIGLADTTINNNPIQSAQANFLYQDARLRLQSSLVVDNPNDPLTLSASVPYRLPFAQQTPLSSDLAVDVDVRDEGIALLNLFTRAVSWESGKGAVNLTVRGNWEDGQAPVISTLAGMANFEDAVVRAEVLPEPVTNLDGQVRFQQDRIVVERLTGEFSKGNLFAQGALPLLTPIQTDFDPDAEVISTAVAGAEIARSAVNPEAASSASSAAPAETGGVLPQPGSSATVVDTPLTLNGENIALNFKGIYNGQVNGQVQIGGSVFLYGPIIHGSVVLSDGRLSLPRDRVSDLSAQPVAASSKRGGTFSPLPPILDDLSLYLDDNIRIIVPGLVDVAAQGEVNVNGIFPALEPVGRIRLPSGRINLVTTQFRLSGDDNYAEFRPNLGLEPYLKATLRAAVATSAGNTTTLVQGTFFPSNEVSDAPVDRLGLNQTGIETIRIQAQVEGPVSQVADLRGVTLTSTPSRSEGEIISLISGGFFTALESTLGTVGGSGDSFQGLIALAGTALLNNLQDVLGSALNLSELRLYTTANARGSQGANNSLDFGGEIGFALSPSISLSVQKTFTTVTPAQLNVRYRLSNEFTVRGTTSYENFRESSGVLLEYESRF